MNALLLLALGDSGSPCFRPEPKVPIVPLKWTQEAYLKAPNAEAGDWFGWAVAADTNTIAVSARHEDSNQTTITNAETGSNDNSLSNSGAIYIFRRVGSSWKQEAFIKSPNTDINDTFGDSISLSNDTLVVGVLGEDSNETTISAGSYGSLDNSLPNSGAVYVFRANGSTWSQQAYIKAINSNNDDRFGQSVSISGDTLIVGAAFEDSNQTTISNGVTASANNAAIQSGAVYIYKRLANNWSQEAYIKASNSDAIDQFGSAVAIDLDTIVVGTPGEASNQTTITNGSTASADNSVTNSGAAYVFVRSGTNWSQQAYIKAANAEAEDRFGDGVSISGDTIVVGAFLEDSNQTTITNGSTASADNSAPNSGAAYVFVRSGTNWSQQAYLKAPNADPEDRFGNGAISGDAIVVAASGEDSNQTTVTDGNTASTDNSATNAGAVYVFVRSGTNWSQQAYLKAPNAEAGDRFGNRVSISGDTIVVGAFVEDSNQTTITNGNTASADNSATDAGAAYVFVRK